MPRASPWASCPAARRKRSASSTAGTSCETELYRTRRRRPDGLPRSFCARATFFGADLMITELRMPFRMFHVKHPFGGGGGGFAGIFCMMEALHYGRVMACTPRRDVPPSNSTGQLQLAVAAVCRSLAPRPADSLVTVFAAQPASPHASDAVVTTSAMSGWSVLSPIMQPRSSDTPLAGRTAYRTISYYSYRYL